MCTECWHFDNDSTSNIDDIPTEHGGLLHVLPLTPLVTKYAVFFKAFLRRNSVTSMAGTNVELE